MADTAPAPVSSLPVAKRPGGVLPPRGTRGHHPGSPGKLTPDRHEAIVRSVREGQPQEVAARLNGISLPCYLAWLRRGSADREAGADTKYARFWLAVQRAEDELEAEMSLAWQRAATERQDKVIKESKQVVVQSKDGKTTNIVTLESSRVESMPPSWQAGAEFLRRRRHERWSTKDKVEVTGADGGPIQVQHSVDVDALSTADKLVMVTLLEKMGIGGVTDSNKLLMPTDDDDDTIDGEELSEMPLSSSLPSIDYGNLLRPYG